MRHCPKCGCNEQQTTMMEIGGDAQRVRTYCIHCGYLWPAQYEYTQNEDETDANQRVEL